MAEPQLSVRSAKARDLARRLARRERRLVLSKEVEDEYRDVIFCPKFDRFVDRAPGAGSRSCVAFAEQIEPRETVRECRDPKDDKHLALAAADAADVIISSGARCLQSGSLPDGWTRRIRVEEIEFRIKTRGMLSASPPRNGISAAQI